jgi:hypothetical protein
LGPAFSQTPLKLAPDLDEVEALAPEREALWSRLEKTTFLTNDEKRAVIGYGPVGSATPDKLFNPGQTRVPAGRPGGGRWGNGPSESGSSNTGADFGTGDGGDGGDGSTSDAPQADPSEWPTWDNPDLVNVADKKPERKYNVDLVEEEARGGHTLEKHKGQTDEALVEFVRNDVRVLSDGQVKFRKLQSSFASTESANDYVNRLLESDKQSVDKVASGELSNKWIEQRFGYPTGTQAYRPTLQDDPYIRKAYNAGVLIIHDVRSPRGYTVLTAYPTNDDPK